MKIEFIILLCVSTERVTSWLNIENYICLILIYQVVSHFMRASMWSQDLPSSQYLRQSIVKLDLEYAMISDSQSMHFNSWSTVLKLYAIQLISQWGLVRCILIHWKELELLITKCSLWHVHVLQILRTRICFRVGVIHRCTHLGASYYVILLLKRLLFMQTLTLRKSRIWGNRLWYWVIDARSC